MDEAVVRGTDREVVDEEEEEAGPATDIHDIVHIHNTRALYNVHTCTCTCTCTLYIHVHVHVYMNAVSLPIFRPKHTSHMYVYICVI